MFGSAEDVAEMVTKIRGLLAGSKAGCKATYNTKRLAAHVGKMGKALNLTPKQLETLELAARVFDIGAAWTPGQTLLKPGHLVGAEWREIENHPLIGQQVAETIPGLEQVANIVLCHHERWDGSGYPGGLRGNEIPLESRILAIVDAYDSMTCPRPYRPAMSPKRAAEELVNCSGTHFDPELVGVFIDTVLEEQI